MAEQHIHLSILDIGTKWNGDSTEQTLRESLELAQHAEQLGYTRYWFAEHHNTAHQTSSSPEVLTALAASVTSSIRVGTGGVMLPNHSALKVAESFSLLQNLNPGRIDLGLGRAPGTDGTTALALRRSVRALQHDDFSEQLDELLAYFTEQRHPSENVKLTPPLPSYPEIYMLGSSSGGMQYAAQHGLGLAFAAHISPEYAASVLKAYHQLFRPSVHMSKPTSLVSIMAIAADTEEEGKRLAGPLELSWVRWNTGVLQLPPPTIEEAAQYRYNSHESSVREANKARFIAGSARQVAEGIRRLAQLTQTNEVMLLQMVPDLAAKKRSMELLAKEFNLHAVRSKNNSE